MAQKLAEHAKSPVVNVGSPQTPKKRVSKTKRVRHWSTIKEPTKDCFGQHKAQLAWSKNDGQQKGQTPYLQRLALTVLVCLTQEVAAEGLEQHPKTHGNRRYSGGCEAKPEAKDDVAEMHARLVEYFDVDELALLIQRLHQRSKPKSDCQTMLKYRLAPATVTFAPNFPK